MSSYSKGSLSHESLPILLSLSGNEIIEPAFEDAFEKHVKDDVKQIIAETVIAETESVQTFTFEVLAVKLGKFILGSKKSRYSASLMKVKNTNGIVTLAEVQHYARCTATQGVQLLMNVLTPKKKYGWLVAVNFFESHVCKPMEVWPAIPTCVIFPVSFIVSRMLIVFWKRLIM